jgi:photosystem II stability/assembly factor-like uncharacterized protein
MADRDHVFAATGQDVVRIALAGARAWQPEALLQGVGAHCVTVDPRDPNRVYAGTPDDGLFASRDGGLSWRQDERGLEHRRVMSLAVSPSHQEAGISVLYAGTEPSNLYRSQDGGRTFIRLPALRELPSARSWSYPPRPWTHHVRTIAPHPRDPDWLAVGIELGGVMRSQDAGASWIDHNPQAHSDAHQLLTHPLAPHSLYEVAGQGIARSDDLGYSWQRIDAGLDRHYAWAQALDPADPDLWYVAISRSPFAAHGDGDGQARLYRSRGDGFTPTNSWDDKPELRRMPYALTSLPDRAGHLLVALRGGTLLLTPDAGETWMPLSVRLPDVIDLAVAHA